MEQLRNEIYDDNGLVRVEFIEIDGPTVDDLIQEKENQLLALYEELEALRQQ